MLQFIIVVILCIKEGMRKEKKRKNYEQQPKIDAQLRFCIQILILWHSFKYSKGSIFTMYIYCLGI